MRPFATVSAANSPSSFNLNVLFLCRAWNRSNSTHRANNGVFHHHQQYPNKPHTFPFHRLHRANVPTRVTNESSGSRTEVSPDAASERSQGDKIVDSMDFGELCNEFECISSPYVEATARQLVRDILELREGNRALGTFASFVKYKDPVRSFTGRDKYKRRLWAADALDNPTVSVQQMVMLSTSELNIRWTLRGKPKSPIFSIGGDLTVKVNSKFTLNQISGQVIEHEETWDLSGSSLLAQAYFWASRRIFATVQTGKDVSDSIKDLTNRFTTQNKNVDMYPDPTGDPTKFFQRDDSFQRDFYQIALFLAVVYFVIQFLRTTL